MFKTNHIRQADNASNTWPAWLKILTLLHIFADWSHPVFKGIVLGVGLLEGLNLCLASALVKIDPAHAAVWSLFGYFPIFLFGLCFLVNPLGRWGYRVWRSLFAQPLHCLRTHWVNLAVNSPASLQAIWVTDLPNRSFWKQAYYQALLVEVVCSYEQRESLLTLLSAIGLCMQHSPIGRWCLNQLSLLWATSPEVADRLEVLGCVPTTSRKVENLQTSPLATVTRVSVFQTKKPISQQEILRRLQFWAGWLRRGAIFCNALYVSFLLGFWGALIGVFFLSGVRFSWFHLVEVVLLSGCIGGVVVAYALQGRAAFHSSTLTRLSLPALCRLLSLLQEHIVSAEAIPPLVDIAYFVGSFGFLANGQDGACAGQLLKAINCYWESFFEDSPLRLRRHHFLFLEAICQGAHFEQIPGNYSRSMLLWLRPFMLSGAVHLIGFSEKPEMAKSLYTCLEDCEELLLRQALTVSLQRLKARDRAVKTMLRPPQLSTANATELLRAESCESKEEED
jgi:hypothetical protein